MEKKTMEKKTTETKSPLDELKSEAREIGNQLSVAANEGDGEKIIALRDRSQKLRLLIDMAELRQIDARLPDARKRAEITAAPEDRAAAEAEYEAAIDAVRVSQDRLNELYRRNDHRLEEKRSARFELADLERRRAEIVARAASPTMAVQSLAHV